ncbi:FGE-sulfatase domain-containing protein [Gammaproteobacteria bacterium]
MDSFTLRLLQEKLTNRIAVNTKDGSVLVYVPAGEFEMGDGHNIDCPKHKVQLSAYWIGIYTVSNGQYLKFLEDSGHNAPNNSHYNDNAFFNHPVTDVSWGDALAYASWAGCQLPTEAQWEKAARGGRDLLYPWGKDWDSTKCQHDKSLNEGTCSVYDYPEGVSGYGTYNQSGNVWEWCMDFYDSNYYRHSLERNPMGSGALYRVNRGGCWWNGGSLYFLATNRNKNDPEYYANNLGFRLVKTHNSLI